MVYDNRHGWTGQKKEKRRQEKTRENKTRQGKTRQDKVIRDNTFGLLGDLNTEDEVIHTKCFDIRHTSSLIEMK